MLSRPGLGLVDQPGDAGDFAELASGEFVGVEAGEEVFEKILRAEQGAEDGFVE